GSRHLAQLGRAAPHDVELRRDRPHDEAPGARAPPHPAPAGGDPRVLREFPRVERSHRAAQPGAHRGAHRALRAAPQGKPRPALQPRLSGPAPEGGRHRARAGHRERSHGGRCRPGLSGALAVRPIPVLTTEELRAVESGAGAERLMIAAGRAVAEAARALAADTGQTILVVAGPGNNGGDAWVAADALLQSFHRVVVLEASATPPKAPEARDARAAFASRGGSIVREWPAASPAPALIVDGLLGIGLARDVDPPFHGIIERVNGSGAPVLAIDVPSGLDSSTGRVRGIAVRATRTLTFIAHKAGLHTLDGPDFCGVVACDDLGVGEAAAREAHGLLLTPATVTPWLAPRRRNSHKGDFGTLAVIGGNRGMVGAALLAGRAGLLAGAGRVYVALLGSDAPAVDPGQPELMLRGLEEAFTADAIVAGPGAGRSPSATSPSLFERTTLPALIARPAALVLDADALNAIAFDEGLQRALRDERKGPTILTPHPAEAARLLGTTTARVQEDRLAAALTLAQ